MRRLLSSAVDESVLQEHVAIVTRLTRVPLREVVIKERWPSVSVVSPEVVLDCSGYLASVSASSLPGIPLWSDSHRSVEIQKTAGVDRF